MEGFYVFVLDASVIMKWFVEEKDAEKALIFRDKYEAGIFELCCPDLLLFEISNIMSFKRSITKEEIIEALNTILDLEIEIVAPTLELLNDAVSLSREKSISVYDSSYIVLSKKMDYQFITADDKLYSKVKTLPHVKLLKDVQI